MKFNLNLVGRVKNEDLPVSHSAQPLFEAIINSIQAIGSKNFNNGLITIRIERDAAQLHLNEALSADRRIKNIIITDNGPGFNEENFRSFLTSDSDFKDTLGGKGIGRLYWLKAFERVHIDSRYTESSETYDRRFDFCLNENGIDDHSLTRRDDSSQNTTSVKLCSMHERYAKTFPKTLQIIAERIIEHCLIYLQDKNCPEIQLSDGEKTLNVNRIFKEEVANEPSANIQIKGNQFSLRLFKIRSSELRLNQLVYCAHSREVMSESLSKHIPELAGRIESQADRYWLHVYILGEHLDSNVNSSRTGFTLAETYELESPEFLGIAEIREAAIAQIKMRLSSYIDERKQEAVAAIERHITNSAPQYKHLLKRKAEEVRQLPPGLGPERLDNELHRINSEFEREIKSEASLLKEKHSRENISDYKPRFDALASKLRDYGSSKLMEYVIHRKLVLDVMEARIQRQQDNKYLNEEDVHMLVYPLRSDSDETEYAGHNLWLIDEKLSYHYYLASDKQLRSLPVIDSTSRNRPDLLVFNAPHAFSEDRKPYASITIIEFKRPVRDDYDDSENPITQVLNYAKELRSSRSSDSTGRPIDAGTIPFYAYIICDLTPRLREVADNYDYTLSPDNLGYFGYNKALMTYVEIVSFDKLLEDAKRRNRVLFDKLGI